MARKPRVTRAQMAERREEQRAEILERLASGQTLTSICKAEHLPSVPTVLGWALDTADPFAEQYAHARLIGYHVMADELIDIMDDGHNDYMERELESGVRVSIVDHEHIARSRLRFEGRKWLLSKALPKIYGDKLALTDPDGGVLTVKFVQ